MHKENGKIWNEQNSEEALSTELGSYGGRGTTRREALTKRWRRSRSRVMTANQIGVREESEGDFFFFLNMPLLLSG